MITRIFVVRNLLRAAAFLPIIAAYTLVAITEPFPRDWLDRSNPHYWPNLLRAGTFLFSGLVLGMITFTLIRAINAERSVSGGHPRRKLYRHVTLISVAHGFLIATLLFYIRERINDPLSPATPIALAGLIGTFYALALMLSYQNSRLHRYHSAKQILGTITPTPERGGLTLHVVGSADEAFSLDEWFADFQYGSLVRLCVEKIEESPDGIGRRLRWLARLGEELFDA